MSAPAPSSGEESFRLKPEATSYTVADAAEGSRSFRLQPEGPKGNGGMRSQPEVRRLRALTPGQHARLDALRGIARLLDSAFVVPGTSYRVGLDPILGLVPGLGDLISPLFTIAILWQGVALRIPRAVQLRMIGNAAIDGLIGLIPLAGDLFDFAWKANVRNLALLERHAFEHRRASAGDWLFATTMVVVLLAIAAAPFLLVAWLVRVL
jgi:hypothetical protein